MYKKAVLATRFNALAGAKESGPERSTTSSIIFATLAEAMVTQ
jgi:hypothetical protein